MEAKFQCMACQYKFTPKNPDSVPKNCPYCNKEETVERVKSAQDLIDDIGNAI